MPDWRVAHIDISRISECARSELAARRLFSTMFTTLLVGGLMFGCMIVFQPPSDFTLAILQLCFAGLFAYMASFRFSRALVAFFNEIILARGPRAQQQFSPELFRGMKVSGYNESADELFGAVYRWRSESTRDLAIPHQRNLVAIFWLSATTLTLSLALALLVLSLRLSFIAGLPALIFLGIGLVSWQKMRVYRQASAKQTLNSDPRKPILWLRSFSDDDLTTIDDALADRYMGARIDRSIEEQLSDELWYYGPVVAIGAPGEALPKLGAAREYFGDSEWHAAVQEWMSAAKIIVIVAGKSSWLPWEVEVAAKHGHLAKTIFIFPPATKDERALRWTNTISSLGGSADYAELFRANVTYARAAYFRRDGLFVVINDVARDNLAYEFAIRTIVYGMFC